MLQNYPISITFGKKKIYILISVKVFFSIIVDGNWHNSNKVKEILVTNQLRFADKYPVKTGLKMW